MSRQYPLQDPDTGLPPLCFPPQPPWGQQCHACPTAWPPPALRVGRGHSPPLLISQRSQTCPGSMVMKLGSFTDGQAVTGHPTPMQTPVSLLQTLLCSGGTCQLLLGRAADLRVHSVCLGLISQGPNPSPMHRVPGQSSAPETLQPGWCENAEPRKKARSSSRLAPMWQLEPFGEKICSLASGKRETRFGGSEGKQHVSLQLWAAGTRSCLGAGPGSGSRT